MDMDDDIREIAASIWETLFSVPLQPAADHVQVDAAQVVTGCVQIDGAWNGAVMLQCGAELATRLAAELFRADAPGPDDVRDTIGELTNMMAGNVKALLPEPSRISLPAVAFGNDYAITVLGTKPVATVAFTSADAPLVVTVLQGAAGQVDP